MVFVVFVTLTPWLFSTNDTEKCYLCKNTRKIKFTLPYIVRYGTNSWYFFLSCNRSGKYVINAGSSDEDVDENEARSTSRPSSMYSEDTVGSVDLGDSNTNISLTSTSTIGGESGDGTKKKGFVINPDYMWCQRKSIEDLMLRPGKTW